MDIIILHGWGSSSQRWQLVRGILESKGFSVLIPDLPGFGEEPTPVQPWAIEQYVDWLDRWVEKKRQSGMLGTPFCLVGHSFGGAMATLFVARYSEKVEKLILAAPAIRRPKKIKHSFFFALSKIGNLIFSLPFLSFLRPLAQKAIYKLSGVQDYYKLILKDDPVLKETFKKIIRQDLTKYLSEISCPTLIIWGEKDFITPIKDAYFIASKIKGAQLKIIKGKGHELNFRAPKELAEEMITFLEQ